MGDQQTENGESEKTVLEADQVAVIFDEEIGFQIMLPQFEGDEDMPDGALALIAAGMHLADDPAFYQELVSWIKTRADKIPG